MEIGYVKLQRCDIARELLGDMEASHLLQVIAFRARFSDAPNLHGLTFGQALIGDFTSYGMTEKQYRGAKTRLERYGLVKFVPSNKGTVATLCDSRVWSLKDEREGHDKGGRGGGHKGGQSSEEKSKKRAGSGACPTAGNGRTEGGRRATNSEGKKGRMISFGEAPAGAGVGSSTKLPQNPDPLFLALCKAEGSDPAVLTPEGRRRVASARADILNGQPNVTPLEVEHKAEAYRRKFPNADCTAHALSKHWARLGGARPERCPNAIEAEPEYWREMVNDEFPDSEYARGGAKEGEQWASLDPAHRRHFNVTLPGWLKRTGHAAA